MNYSAAFRIRSLFYVTVDSSASRSYARVSYHLEDAFNGIVSIILPFFIGETNSIFVICSMLFYAILLCILPHDIKMSPPTARVEKDSGLLWNALRISKTLFEKCSKESGVTWRSPLGYYDIADLIRECFLRRSLLVLDRLRAIDHLQICRGVDLVRYRNDSEADVR